MIGRLPVPAARPGLVRSAGHTALLAGDATAVSGRMAATWQTKAAAAAPPPHPRQAQPCLAAFAGELQQGLRDDTEFAVAKAELPAG